ncbi:MAG: hypothetical protein ABI333_19600 [bacterium]
MIRRLVSLLVALLAVAGACGGKTSSRRGARDASVRRSVPADAGSPVSPDARKTLHLGGACACQPVPPNAVLAHEEARQVLVRHIDQLNQGLRTVTERLDRAVADESKDQLDRPDAILAQQQRLVCRLDCLLAQFVGATDALWSYLRVASALLDTIRNEVRRLSSPPVGRPPGPGLAGLRKQFNGLARSSNQTIGLALITARPPVPRMELDQRSFAVKSQRWIQRARKEVADFTGLWLPLVHPKTPRGTALDRPVRLRVAIARLQQRLALRSAQAEALHCQKGETCSALRASWTAVQQTTRALSKALGRAATRLRAAGHPGLTLAQGRGLTRQLEQALGAWTTAVTKL